MWRKIHFELRCNLEWELKYMMTQLLKNLENDENAKLTVALFPFSAWQPTRGTPAPDAQYHSWSESWQPDRWLSTERFLTRSPQVFRFRLQKKYHEACRSYPPWYDADDRRHGLPSPASLLSAHVLQTAGLKQICFPYNVNKNIMRPQCGQFFFYLASSAYLYTVDRRHYMYKRIKQHFIIN